MYLIVVKPFKSKRNFIFNLMNEAHILAYYGILFASLGKDSVIKAKLMKYLIIVIVSCLLVNAGFNLIELSVSVVKWIKVKLNNKSKVKPAMGVETGDVIKIIGSKEQDEVKSNMIGFS